MPSPETNNSGISNGKRVSHSLSSLIELMSGPWDWVRQPSIRLPLLLLLHTGLFAAIYAFSFAARFNFRVPPSYFQLFLSTVGPVVLAKLTVFYFGSHFHGWWRYVTFADLRSLLKVSLLSMVVVVFIDYYALPFPSPIPRLSILLDTIMTVVVIGGLRCTWRFADEMVGNKLNPRIKRPAVLVGTDHLIGQLAAQINSNPSMPCRVKALLATGAKYRRKAILGGVRVMGHIDDVVEVAQRSGASDVLVPADELEGKELRQLINRCNDASLTVRVLPRFEDAFNGTDQIPLRPLDIDDLLQREPVKLDTTEVEKLIRDRRVLVTGAGGSIGSEICRQLIRFKPAELIVLGRGENRIHAISNELLEIAGSLGVKISIEIGDITDRPRMRRLFEERLPELVFHAAAHKHVPLMELHPGEAVKNNVGGTKVLASLADEFQVKNFVLVSSDKAVNPTSIMGCTKRLAERVVCAFAQSSDTKYAIVRFGNVLGSAGSVIPKFQEQIRKGGPITITDERMTRFFMSIPEASQLVLQSASMCRGGEIYVLDMGEPVRIVQLAEDLVTLSGLSKRSIEFSFTGIRPGEKLYEELYFEGEKTLPTQHPKVRAAYASDFEDDGNLDGIDDLIGMADGDRDELYFAISRLISAYALPASMMPSETFKMDQPGAVS